MPGTSPENSQSSADRGSAQAAGVSLKSLIFDVDGTLAETEELHRRAFNDSFADAGLGWAWDAELYGRLLAVTGGKERIRHFIDSHGCRPDLGPDEIAALHAFKTARYARLVGEGALRLRPGIERLLREARSAGIRLAIATTTTLANIDVLLRATLGADGAGWFDVIAAATRLPPKSPHLISIIWRWPGSVSTRRSASPSRTRRTA
jgi:phosphoglycolate phosphatase-like HAD superfamily hydrolase